MTLSSDQFAPRGLDAMLIVYFLYDRTYAILSIARALTERSYKKRRRFLDTT